mmetsp:Transcript_23012/g.32177  ORF Transcript_23012/g.32177 Transcript_23012/m.32177 type:complete len:105 (-) Transcript_23012:6-320(-)
MQEHDLSSKTPVVSGKHKRGRLRRASQTSCALCLCDGLECNPFPSFPTPALISTQHSPTTIFNKFDAALLHPNACFRCGSCAHEFCVNAKFNVQHARPHHACIF